MPDSKEISQLITAEQESANDLFETSIPNAMTETGYVSRKRTFAVVANWICNVFQFTSSLQTTAKTIIGAINEVAQNASGYVEATGTLTAGQTTVTISNANITTTSTIDPYVDPAFTGVSPTAMTLATGSVTLTFPTQSTNMPVKVRIS